MAALKLAAPADIDVAESLGAKVAKSDLLLGSRRDSSCLQWGRFHAVPTACDVSVPWVLRKRTLSGGGGGQDIPPLWVIVCCCVVFVLLVMSACPTRFVADAPPMDGIVTMTPQSGLAVTTAFSGTTSWVDEALEQNTFAFYIFPSEQQLSSMLHRPLKHIGWAWAVLSAAFKHVLF